MGGNSQQIQKIVMQNAVPKHFLQKAENRSLPIEI